MTQFISLSSGSNGNCYYIGNGTSGILIDVGIGGRTIRKRLLNAGIDIATIGAVLVSHDHFDHIRSLGTFTRMFRIPVYSTAEIIAAFERHFCTRGYMHGCCTPLEPGVAFEMPLRGGLASGGLMVTPFRVPHDAADNVGYHIDFFGEKFTFMTDIGAVTPDAIRFASLADHLIVESNYDYDMLINGPYDEDLKLRIRQGRGHLSNEQTASLIAGSIEAASPRCVRDIFLCHLSENNNTPQKALAASSGVIPEGVELHALPRREPSRLFEW